LKVGRSRERREDQRRPRRAKAFGAEKLTRYEGPEGAIMHAQVRIGDSMLEISDGSAEFPPRPGSIHVYVPDVDAVYAKALHAGATSLREVTDQFYGDREGSITDPFGNQWFLSTHVKDVTEEEMMAHMAAQQQA
jgi:PhnB protein